MEVPAVLALSVAIGHATPLAVEEALRMYESERMARHELETHFANHYVFMYTTFSQLRDLVRSLRARVAGVVSLLSLGRFYAGINILMNVVADTAVVPSDDDDDV